jgi:hypothetical protein
MTPYEYLRSVGACDEALTWASGQPDIPTAWKNCRRYDWMMWLLEKRGYNDARILRLIACDCAETVLHLVPPGEDRPHIAIETARRYAEGRATAKELQAAGAARAAGAAGAAARAAGAATEADQSDIIRKYLPELP